MLPRWLVPAVAVAGCVSVPPPGDPAAEVVPVNPGVVKLLLSKEETLRLSRAGIMDPSSPSGLTDRFRYRAALEAYVAETLRQRGLCRGGFGDLQVSPAPQPYDTMITVACQ